MGRSPAYDRHDALTAAAALFGRAGYEGCSVDDLVKGLGIHRGSLYKAFGSKRSLFVEALRNHVDGPVARLAQDIADSPAAAEYGAALAASSHDLDLLLVAALEAGGDPVVGPILEQAVTSLGHGCASAEGAECSDVEARSAGLLLLTCRLAARCLPGSELPHHLRRFSLLSHLKGLTWPRSPSPTGR